MVAVSDDGAGLAGEIAVVAADSETDEITKDGSALTAPPVELLRGGKLRHRRFSEGTAVAVG